MNKNTIALTAAGLGAAAMYLLDPGRGRRRRARLGEVVVHVAHRAQATTGVTVRDVRHRLSGMAARALDRLRVEPTPPDDVLVERVRARLGRLVSHPGAIEVAAKGGTVTLKGPVFEAEFEQLMNGASAVAGVTAVENRLEPHRDAAHVSALQGRGPRTIPSNGASWPRWTPTSRLAAGAAGVTLLALSLPRRPFRGAAARIWGVELLACALLGGRQPSTGRVHAGRRVDQ
jgi:BON domain-containing protein